MIQCYKREDGKTETTGGLPLPLTGKPITKTPVVVKKEGIELRRYPEFFIPGKEELDKDEMRLTCIGSGNPVVRRAQAAAGWLVELGNGDRFIFDLGGGSVQNLWSLEIPPVLLNKLFITHLHLDHIGGFHAFYDSMGWARNVPLHIWGPSGYTKEMGTEAFCHHIRKAAEWHIQSRMGVVPSEGTKIYPREFDVAGFSPEHPRMLIYDKNGVKIFAFPVVHCIFGAVGYRLEWNGLSMSYHGDGTPSSFEAEQAKGVDLFMHEAFMDSVTCHNKINVPLRNAELITRNHTTGDRFGELMEISKAKLSVGYHYLLGDDTIDPFFKRLIKISNRPFVMAQDLMVINITDSQIVTRMAKTSLLHYPLPAPLAMDEWEMGPHSKAVIPEWLTKTVINKVVKE